MATLKNTLINDTGYLQLPTGTTAQRPVSPSDGYMRYNTTNSVVEVYSNGTWRDIVFASSYITDGLVMYLDAGDTNSYSGTGTTWTDLSANGLNSSLVNGVSYNSSNNGSLVFDGSNDYISVPAPSSPISFGTGLTHEVWIYPTDYTNSGGNRQYLIDPRGNGTTTGMNAYFLFDYISAPDTVRITVGNNGVEVLSTNFSMPLNQWHHLAATRNGSSWVIYVNGTSISTGTSNTTSLTLNNSFRVATYANGTSGQYFYEGRMAVVRLYSRGLSSAEITQNYNEFTARLG